MKAYENACYLNHLGIFLKGHKFQVFCKENLEMNVSPQNVLEILDAANSMRIVDMKNYALELIVQNYHQVRG